MPLVRIESTKDGIFHLNIDDPANQNRLTQELCEELKAALAVLANEASMKVLILSGRKEVFCAGASLELLRQISTDGAVEDLVIGHQLLGLSVPVLAAMEGHAVGGGLVLGMCCDITIASETSRYGLNFLTMGFTPGMGTTGLVPALVGPSFAAEMMLTGKFYKGRDLRGRGLLTHIVPGEEVLSKTWDLARSMADKPKYALEMVKDAVMAPRRHAFQDALSRERLMHKACFSNPEAWAMIEKSYLGKD
jgi:polyketide biosynthesis enoyl-CoA hydratase PksI